jgi:flagellar motor switch protein FliM
MKVPLSTIAGPQVGQVLPLEGCTVSKVRLVDPGGRTLARGRLGPIAGQIAVRIQAAADIIQMTEMGGENGADLPNRTIRTRAGDGQATQFEADYDADPDWYAAALPL